MALDLAAFVQSEKMLAIQPDWIVTDSEWLSLTCPIDIDGVTIPNVRLTAKANLRQADRHIVVQIEHDPYADYGGPICRMEWKPFNSHNNKGIGPKEFRFKEIRCSHHHPFDLNWQYCEKQVRRGKLPLAIPIEPDPVNCREFLALVGVSFKIANIQRVGVPPWQPAFL
jgi:hypothetical protein